MPRGDGIPFSKPNRRRAQESERKRMKEDGRIYKTIQRNIQERAEGKRPVSKRRRKKH